MAMLMAAVAMVAASHPATHVSGAAFSWLWQVQVSVRSLEVAEHIEGRRRCLPPSQKVRMQLLIFHGRRYTEKSTVSILSRTPSLSTYKPQAQEGVREGNGFAGRECRAMLYDLLFCMSPQRIFSSLPGERDSCSPSGQDSM